MEKIQKNHQNGGLKMTVIAMFVLIVLGRGVSYFNTVAANDVSYASWVSSALSYIAELLVCARVVLAIAGITYAVYCRSGAGKYLAAAAGAAFADYGARFLIDLVTNAIADAELVAAIWLLLQFLFEMLFVAASYFIAGWMNKKFRSTEIRRQAEKYSVNRSCMVSLLLVMLSRIALEIWYLIDFMIAYSDITSTETASIVGSFLKVIVIYGGAAVLLGEWYTERLKSLKKLNNQNVKRA